MLIHRLQDAGQNQQELHVLVGRGARIQKIDAIVGGDGPVVVLSGAVHAGEGFFVEQALKAVAAGYHFQGLHHDLVLIHRHVGLCIDRRQLMLGRSYLVMLSLCRYSKLPQLLVYLLHKSGDALTDRAEIMILQLLPFGRHRSEQGPSGVNQILSLQVFLLIHQEIFLLRPHRGRHLFGGRVAKEPQEAQGLGVDRFHGTKQRRFLIQGLACVGAKSGGNAERGSRRVLPYKGRRGAVPGRVAPGLKGGPQSPRREGGGVRLALDELLSGKAHQHLAALIRSADKGIVLLRRHSGHGLEPVGVVGSALFDGPLLHLMGHHIRRGQIQLLALLYGFLQLLIDLLRKPLLHDRIVEYVGAENL